MQTLSTRNLLFLFLLVIAQPSIAQDTIIKRNGDILLAQILEMGTNAVSYKRADFTDGPTFIENNVDIFMIKFRNGQKQAFKEEAIAAADDYVPTTSTPVLTKEGIAGNNKMPASPSTEALKKGPLSESYRIEQLNGRYMVNGQKIGRKELDRQLARSTNPAVKAGLKAAKTTKTLQKIVGLTSIPTTIAGGVTSIVTFANLYSAYNHGTLTTANYVNTGLSFLGTLSLPITSKFLKKRRDKMYDGLIEMHNMTSR